MNRNRNRNRSLRRFLLVAVFIACVWLAAGAAFAKVYMTPEFMTRNPRPVKVAVLPPQADFIKNQAVMTADMVKEAAALEDAAGQAVEAQLQDKGYEARLLTQADFDATPGLREMVRALNKRYDEEWAKLLGHPKDLRAGRFSAGEHVSELCALLGVEGLVVVRITASAPTGGKQALTLLLSLGQAYAQGQANIFLSVLAGKTGRLEAFFHALKTCTLGSLTKKPDKVMSELVAKSLDELPAFSEVLTPKKGAATAEAKDPAELKDDAAAIADFEAVLKSRGVEVPAPPAEGAAEGSPAVPAQAPPEGTPTPEPTPDETPPPEPTPTPASASAPGQAG